jgi:hypothetical protein
MSQMQVINNQMPRYRGILHAHLARTMPSTWENIRVTGTMILRGGLALSPIVAAYQVPSLAASTYFPADNPPRQGRALVPPPAPSATTQAALALLAASGVPTLVGIAPALLGLRPRPSASPLFVPVTTFVVLVDVFSWAGALVLARRRRTGRGAWLLDTMGVFGLTSAVVLGLGSVIRKCA